MEILLKGSTSISETNKKIEVSDLDFEVIGPEEIILDNLQLKYIFAKVTVNAKVQKTTKPEIVSTGK